MLFLPSYLNCESLFNISHYIIVYFIISLMISRQYMFHYTIAWLSACTWLSACACVSKSVPKNRCMREIGSELRQTSLQAEFVLRRSSVDHIPCMYAGVHAHIINHGMI